MAEAKMISTGAARLPVDHLPARALERAEGMGAIVTNAARNRPRYFDGRFLAAADLTREQDYFIARQADLARAAGGGVLHGLVVTLDDLTADAKSRVRIGPGTGITPAGQLLVLRSDANGRGLSVDLADTVPISTLEGALGLEAVPNEPPRLRTGLFVLALRPLEFTANPIATYPTSVVERRMPEDGEIIEAVALTLVPYREQGDALEPLAQRAEAARKIFLERASGVTPAEVLPLAMVQLERGELKWLDCELVRRELGSEPELGFGIDRAAREVREAHVLQQTAHLGDVIAKLRASGGARFAAAELFRALPAAGQLPIEAIERLGVGRYTQSFFPAAMGSLLVLVPEDELAALVDEAALLPAIDVTASAEELALTRVMVLLPVGRERLDRDRRRTALPLTPASIATAARRQDDLLRGPLAQPRPRREAAPEPGGESNADDARIDARFRDALAAVERDPGVLWYVRARTSQWRVLGRVVGADPPRLAEPWRAITLPAEFRPDEAHPLRATHSPIPGEG